MKANQPSTRKQKYIIIATVIVIFIVAAVIVVVVKAAGGDNPAPVALTSAETNSIASTRTQLPVETTSTAT